MKRMLIACAGAMALATPTQAAVYIKGVAELTHSWGYADPSEEGGSEGPYLVRMGFRVDSPDGQASRITYCDDCLYASFVGNRLIIQDNGLLPCYCSETYSFTFDRDVSAGWRTLSDAVFVSGYAGFFSGSHEGYESWDGPILTAWLPEPATWAMMLAGFGLAGGMMRRRKVSTTFA